jgi:phage replication-related protein YjqB (UPF0714/DUF867 family)
MDKYENFARLSAQERLGEDYLITCIRRRSPVAIIAPHGGRIEPGTSEIARAIAAEDLNFYAFEGIKRAGNRDLHITSSRFDEPQCLELVSPCAIVVAVHGLAGPERRLEVGGLNEEMRGSIASSLRDAGFEAASVTEGELAGVLSSNICNRGRSGAGVQFEIARGLRDFLVGHAREMERFVSAVRSVITAAAGDAIAVPLSLSADPARNSD